MWRSQLTDDTFKARKRSNRTNTRTQSEYTLRGRTLKRNKHSLLFANEEKKGSPELIEKVEIPEAMVLDALEIVKEFEPDLPLEKQRSLAYADSLNEWMASNVFEFFSEISLLYATVEESHVKLADSGEGKGFPPGAAYQFPGLSDRRASTYVDTVLAWIEDQVHNEKIFPEDEQDPFPSDFVEKYVSDIFKRMFRIYAIILTTCWDALKEHDGRTFATSSFKHFYFFVLRHDLLKNPEEAEVLRSGFKQVSGWDIDSVDKEYRVCADAYAKEH